MNTIRILRRLSPSDRRLLAKVGITVVVVRIALTMSSFRTIQRVVRNVPARPMSRRFPRHSVAAIGWAVRTVSLRVPRATCLTQALAAQALMNREGYPSHLRLGVAREPSGQLGAHAWLESQGTIVIGGERSEEYTPFPPLENV